MLKIGLHSVRPDGAIPALRDALRQSVYFPVMKTVDDWGPLLEVNDLEKQYGVEIKKIGRYTGRDVPALEVGMSLEECKRLAEEQMDWIFDKAEPYLHLPNLYIEPVNEPAWPDIERHLLLCQFLVRCMEIAEGRGIKIALFSYSYGFPQIEWWPKLIATGVFKRAKQGGHILALHEGTAGRDFHEEEVIPWLCHRYRLLYEKLSEEEKIPFVVSEFTFGNVRNYGVEKWVKDLVEYAKELPDYCFGVTPFTLGPFQDFAGEDYEVCLPLLIEELVKAKEEEEEVEYVSHYVLFPQGSSWEWYEAASEYFLRFRCTRGESADDAYKRWGTTHTITMINPRDEFLAYVKEHKDEKTSIDLVKVASPEELKELLDWRAKTGQRFGWPKEELPRRCLVGIHARNDYNLAQDDLDMIRIAKLEAIKFLSFTDPGEALRVRAINPDIFIMVRLFSGDLDQGKMETPIDFVEKRAPEIKAWLDKDVTHFEITNEPNLLCEKGLFCSPEGFCIWFEQVLTLLREQFPDAKFGFPGLSPPLKDLDWLDGCKSAIEKADWLGCHIYWRDRGEFDYWGKHYEEYHKRFPEKTIIITEFSNPKLGPEGEAVQQYLEFYRRLRGVPYIKAAMSFIQSSPDPAWEKESWRDEEGLFKAIVSAVGDRDF
jgi:hypothetical protein